VDLFATLLLVTILAITVLSRKVTRGLELASLAMIGTQLVVPLRAVHRAGATQGLIGGPAEPGAAGAATPRAPYATPLVAQVGFTVLASGLNRYLLNHYRDKRYGMGTGSASSPACAAAAKQPVLPNGVTFPDDGAHFAASILDQECAAGRSTWCCSWDS
jgi:hypothetical protein